MSKAMKHQTVSLKKLAKEPRVFDMSDPGTGKTFVEIMDFVARRKKKGGCLLVLCPKSLMTAAWYNDFKKFAPEMKVSVAYAANRQEAFNVDADVYVTNVDAAKWLAEKPKSFFKKFDTLVIDESTAYKHHTSQRSKAVGKIKQYFEYRRLLSGTPNSNGICDLWHQMMIVDDGKRLGKSFFQFRSACCTPKQVGPSANMVQWVDKPGIETVVTELIKDVTIRHRFEECVDIPENLHYAVPLQLSKKHLATYREMEDFSLAVLANTTITAINGAAVATKLLQISSGAVYDDSGGYTKVASERYELVLDLVEARKHSIVFYQWEHQLEELLAEAKSRKISHVVWNPDKPEIEKQFQAGFFQVLFAHPASAGHGLTLTKGTATIWASPTYNLEWWKQGYKRVHRIGQTEKTENIVVVAEGTIDERAWNALQMKQFKMEDLFCSLEAA